MCDKQNINSVRRDFTENAVALGTFDGLHLGHRAVISNAKGCNLSAFTFFTPPKSFFSGVCELLLMPEDRKAGLESLGVKNTVFADFKTVKDMSALDFLSSILKDFNPSLIVCGFNYRFGKDAVGDTDLLKNFCKKNNIRLEITPPVFENGILISSTYLRNLIKSGNIKTASSHILGGFRFTSPVLHGDKRGRMIGFPTVNQKLPDILVKPKFGVYLSKIIIDNKEYNGITNIGIRPTFETSEVFCETHIFDFSSEIYGKNVTLIPTEFIREEKKFLDIDTLKNAITYDINTAKERLFYEKH